jgi:hypothetical protein
MIVLDSSRRAPVRPVAARVVAASAALALTCGLSACGSSAHSSTTTGAACQQVGAVLSDGPDPSSDPVGYAEAQIRPLRAIHTTDRALQQAIDHLASAYQAFYRAGRVGQSAKRGVTAAATAINGYCPGVATA